MFPVVFKYIGNNKKIIKEKWLYFWKNWYRFISMKKYISRYRYMIRSPNDPISIFYTPYNF